MHAAEKLCSQRLPYEPPVWCSERFLAPPAASHFRFDIFLHLSEAVEPHEDHLVLIAAATSDAMIVRPDEAGVR